MMGVLPLLAKLKGVALDLVFPEYCLGCGVEGALLCQSCCKMLPAITGPVCPLCGVPQPQGHLCHSCRGWHAEIDGIRAPFRFEGVVREAVHRLKYENLRAVARPLAKHLVAHIERAPVRCDVLAPVPLHPRRLRERGYNQSAMLAVELGKLTGLPVDQGALFRMAYVLPQARTASLPERRQNVEGAFVAGGGAAGKTVFLIDDVSTSGATMNACAAALKAVGAVWVWGLALAKEV